MEIRVLQYFLAVAKEESISGAAKFLHLSQPTLSRQLKDMEQMLGKQLFIRGNRKITLTQEGIILKKRAEEIIALVKKAENEIISSDENIAGDIYIGSGETDAVRLIAKIAADLQKKFPKICFHISSSDAIDVLEGLDKGLLDFGIIMDPANLDKYEYLKIPAKDTWGILRRKDSPLSQKSFIAAEDLQNMPLIISRQAMNGPLVQWLKQGLDTFHIVSTYSLIYNASLMVEEGVGYALAIDKIINTTGNSQLCFIPLSPKLEIGMQIVWKKYQVFSKASQQFLMRLQQAFYQNQYEK